MPRTASRQTGDLLRGAHLDEGGLEELGVTTKGIRCPDAIVVQGDERDVPLPFFIARGHLRQGRGLSDARGADHHADLTGIERTRRRKTGIDRSA